MSTVRKFRLSVYCSLVVLLGLCGCWPNVMFNDAMPPDVNSLKQIPEFYQGIYRCASDSSITYVYENVVFVENYFKFLTTLDYVTEKEGCSITEQGIYLESTKQCLPFEYVTEDTIEASIYKIDTIFEISKYGVAKEYKGRLFLNLLQEQNEWVTFMITPEGSGSFKWDMIDVPDTVKKIEEITHEYTSRKISNDKVRYILSPTLVEFDRILKKNYVRECDILEPLNFEIEDPSKFEPF